MRTFRDRPTALARLAAALNARGLELHADADGAVAVRPVAVADAPAAEPAVPASDEIPAEAAEIVADEPAAGRAPDRRLIRVLAAENPKRAGTKRHARFALYRDGMTVEDYVAAGGKRHDVDGDVRRGFVAVEDVR